MKNNFMAIIGLCCVAFATTSVADELPAAPSAVAAAAENVTMLNGQVNPNAQVYFYLHSASWCGPCRMAIPGIMETYKEILADGRAEVILVNYDHSPAEGQDYIKSYATAMPAVHYADPNVAALPGYKNAVGVPYVIVVDAQGNVLDKGAPERIQQWKKYVK